MTGTGVIRPGSKNPGLASQTPKSPDLRLQRGVTEAESRTQGSKNTGGHPHPIAAVLGASPVVVKDSSLLRTILDCRW